MKSRLTAYLCAAVLLVASLRTFAATNSVRFNLGAFGATAVAYKPVRIKPTDASFPRVEGTTVIGRDYGYKITDSSGVFTQSMVSGTYSITFTQQFSPTTFEITVPSTNFVGVLNASELTTSGTNLPSNLAAYSQTAADAMFAKRTNAHQGLQTGGVAIATAGITNINWTTGVTGYLSGATAHIGVNVSAGSGDAGGTNARQWGTDVLTNLSSTASNNIRYVEALAFFTNWSGAISNLAQTKQHGSEVLTNLTSTASNNVHYVTALSYFTNWSGAISNLASTKIDKLNGTGTNLSAQAFTGTTNAPLVIRNTNGAAMTEFASNGTIRAAFVGQYQFVVDGSTGGLTIGEDEAILNPGELVLSFSGPAGIRIVNADLGATPVFKVVGATGEQTNAAAIAVGSITASRVAIWNQHRVLTNSAAVDTTELEFLDGVSSAIQTQFGNGTNHANTKQHGTAILTNISGTGAITNLFSAGNTNATDWAIVQNGTNTTGGIKTITAGANITLTANGSTNLSIAASGGSGTNALIQTNGASVGSAGTVNFIAGNNTTVTGMLNGAVATIAVSMVGTPGYSMQFGYRNSSPPDSTVSFFGSDFGTFDSTTYSNVTLCVPFTGTIRGWSLNYHCTAGSSELFTNKIVINSTTTVGNIEIALNIANTNAVQGSLSQAVNAGDVIAIRHESPAWVTNPAGVHCQAVVFISVP